jgi:mono/diheme cytochrome c family protein
VKRRIRTGETASEHRFAWIVSGAVALVALGLAGAAFAQQDGPDLARGEAVFNAWCAPCHDPGPGHPGTQALQAKYNGDIPAVLEQREDLTPETVAVFVRQGISIMAPFRKTEVSDEDLAALGAYLAQAHSQPADTQQ